MGSDLQISISDTHSQMHLQGKSFSFQALAKRLKRMEQMGMGETSSQCFLLKLLSLNVCWNQNFPNHLLEAKSRLKFCFEEKQNKKFHLQKVASQLPVICHQLENWESNQKEISCKSHLVHKTLAQHQILRKAEATRSNSYSNISSTPLIPQKCRNSEISSSSLCLHVLL